ncbi:hypothetical protein HML84_04590 [Alcanivorax sp. IO_7]|nr:hypothetical protein HML84_04590 [Alcanivorax sp. IO_7]
MTVTSGQDEPVTGGQVTFTGPASGAGLDGASLAATIDADGVASIAVTANGVVGDYAVSADAAGAAASLTFNLENRPIGTELTLAAATPATVNTDFDLTATLSADAALPGGAVDFRSRTTAPGPTWAAAPWPATPPSTPSVAAWPPASTGSGPASRQRHPRSQRLGGSLRRRLSAPGGGRWWRRAAARWR